MFAIQIAENGSPDVMVGRELPTPVPGPQEVLVRVEAAGVNFIDVYLRKGLYKAPLPAVLGSEGAGVVEQLGPGVTTLALGDRVGWSDRTGASSGGGSYATHTVVPVARAIPLPSSVDAPLAAAVLLQGMTAHYLTQSTYPLRAGQVCLVHAAAGGVGLLLCQLAKRAGARVLGTVSTAEKAALARGAGADEVITYAKEDFEVEARRMTNGRGVDVVYDSVGRTTFLKSLGALTSRGMLVLFGQSSGPVEPFDPQLLNAKGSLFVTRPSLNHYTASREELLARASDVLSWASSGALQVRVGAKFALRDAALAHRALEARQTTGKVLLLP